MKFLPSLQGRGKMSSSKEHTFVGLRDSVEEAKEKIDRAKTGGRVTAAEQREKGADPDDDMVFQLMAYLLVDDDEELNEIYERYASGDLQKGELKEVCMDYLEDLFME
jgi:tryptophanyl-tRNA synthetase